MSSVLVVVDMQNGFVSSKAQPVVPKVVELVERWEQTGRDVVFTRFLNEHGSQFENWIHWSRFMKEKEDGSPNPEIDIIPELVAHADRALAVIDKPALYSPFTPDFVELLRDHGWTQFVVAGIATESCVMKTAADSFERGIKPLVVTDACYSHAGQERHLQGLGVIKAFIGRDQLVTIDALFDHLATAA
jgi:nicotinamidase-related amidase